MASLLGGLIAFLPLSWASGLWTLADESLERLYHPDYLVYATGKFSHRFTDSVYDWPVRIHSIGNTMASYQLYSTNLDEAYFHHGIDIRADAGSDVKAVVGGKLLGVNHYRPGDYYWEVAILDSEGFIWQYHHIDRNSIPRRFFSAGQTETHIETGEILGRVVSWPVSSEGEIYHHIHLNVIGAGKAYLNGFAFLKKLPIQNKPEIIDVALLQNGERLDGDRVSGDYSILIEARDLLLSKKFYLPPQRIAFQVDGGREQLTWQFDTLPGGSSNSQYVNEFYVPHLACGNYECRSPIIDLGFRKGGHVAFPSSSGSHRVHITVQDVYGNASSKDFTWIVE